MNERKRYFLTRTYADTTQQEAIFAYRDLVQRHKRVLYKRRKRAEGRVMW